MSTPGLERARVALLCLVTSAMLMLIIVVLVDVLNAHAWAHLVAVVCIVLAFGGIFAAALLLLVSLLLDD